MTLPSRSAEEAAQDVATALGSRPADFVVRGCTLLNLFTAAEESVDLVVRAGVIVAMRTGWRGDAACELDARGLVALPGLLAPWVLTGAPDRSQWRMLLADGTTSAIVAEETSGAAPLRGIDAAALVRSGFAIPLGCAFGEALASANRPAETGPSVPLCIDPEHVRRRLRLGLPVFLGGAPEGVAALVADIVASRTDLGRLCLASGALSAVAAAIDGGATPAQAVRMASLNVATEFGLDDVMGALAPGRRADIVLTEGFASRPRMVILDGVIVAENGRPVRDERLGLPTSPHKDPPT